MCREVKSALLQILQVKSTEFDVGALGCWAGWTEEHPRSPISYPDLQVAKGPPVIHQPGHVRGGRGQVGSDVACTCLTYFSCPLGHFFPPQDSVPCSWSDQGHFHIQFARGQLVDPRGSLTPHSSVHAYDQ